jgi:hypothetical protein
MSEPYCVLVWTIAVCGCPYPNSCCCYHRIAIAVVVILTVRELSRKGLKNRVLRPLDEEVVCQACEKLFPGEGVYWEVVFF